MQCKAKAYMGILLFISLLAGGCSLTGSGKGVPAPEKRRSQKTIEERVPYKKSNGSKGVNYIKRGDDKKTVQF